MLCKSVEDIRQGFLSFNSLLPQCLCLHPPSISGGGPSFAPSPDGLCWFLSFARMMFYWAFCISWALKSFSSLRPLSSAPWTFVSSGMVPCLLLDRCLLYGLHPRAPLPSLQMPGAWLLLSLITKFHFQSSLLPPNGQTSPTLWALSYHWHQDC